MKINVDGIVNGYYTTYNGRHIGRPLLCAFISSAEFGTPIEDRGSVFFLGHWDMGQK